MSGPLHAGALALLESWAAPDPAQEALRAAIVAHLQRHPDGLHRTCRPDHVTASTLVLSPDARSVLLTLHARGGAWFQLGGHVEPEDETLAGAALREALEESGLSRLRLDPDPVHLDAHEVPWCGGTTGVRHLDVRFLAVPEDDAAGRANAESTALRWWPVDALPSGEPSLLRLVELALARTTHRAAATG